jgi:hypothetical protein
MATDVVRNGPWLEAIIPSGTIRVLVGDQGDPEASDTPVDVEVVVSEGR